MFASITDTCIAHLKLAFPTVMFMHNIERYKERLHWKLNKQQIAELTFTIDLRNYVVWDIVLEKSGKMFLVCKHYYQSPFEKSALLESVCKWQLNIEDSQNRWEIANFWKEQEKQQKRLMK